MGIFVPERTYFAGMGEAVADRTVNRKIFTEAQRKRLPKIVKINPNDPEAITWENTCRVSDWPFEIDFGATFFNGKPETRSETWVEVAKRVAEGNVDLVAWESETAMKREEKDMRALIASGALLMSGRHLQHGDKHQKNRPMEIVTNCSTSAFSFLLLYLLLNGSGVGRAYDDDMMKVDWSKAPTTYVTISADHPDRKKMRPAWDAETQSMVMKPLIGPEVETPEWFKSQFGRNMIAEEDKIVWFKIPDSRGGWAKGLEIMERMAFEGKHDWVLVLDYSEVRQEGSPIRGMQNRPSSGPAPIMSAMRKIAAVKFLGLEPWESTMHVDHYAAECVLVGGARRAARMATKTWRDKSVFKFIKIKSQGGLWSSNNSVTIDEEFRTASSRVIKLLKNKPGTPLADIEAGDLVNAKKITEIELHAYRVLIEIASASYNDGTGEPGIINQDRLTANNAGIEEYIDGLYAESRDFQIDAETLPLMREVAEAVIGVLYTMITNPCGEITLLMLGAYCVIADVVPFHAKDDNMAEKAMRMAVRALMRTNTMDCLYKREVRRTNRIGIGLTGFHEWAYDRFGFTWKDLVNEKKSMKLWLTMSRFKRAIVDEAKAYAEILGVVAPHTDTTFKPAGTTSKLFGLTEGAHLPSMRWYLRWVQFRNGDPLIAEYEKRGYPVRQLVTYEGTTIVGFPTAPAISQLGDGEWVTTAAEATPAEQYEFLRLLEKYWLRGVEEDGVTPLADDTGNQISYTLKYLPEVVSFDQFLETLVEGQFSIKCCSVMPQVDASAYEYQPEQPVSREEFDAIVARIGANDNMAQDVDMDTLQCASGACPI